MTFNKKRGVNYLSDISEAIPGQFKHAIIVQKEIEDGGGMYCPMCLSKVSCLNNTNEGEACYQCREKHKLRIIDYPKHPSKLKVNNMKINLSNGKVTNKLGTQQTLLNFKNMKGGE